MTKGMQYIVLIALNIVSIYILLRAQDINNELIEKGAQIAIVIFTFMLFRMYMKERGLMKQKRDEDLK